MLRCNTFPERTGRSSTVVRGLVSSAEPRRRDLAAGQPTRPTAHPSVGAHFCFHLRPRPQPDRSRPPTAHPIVGAQFRCRPTAPARSSHFGNLMSSTNATSAGAAGVPRSSGLHINGRQIRMPRGTSVIPPGPGPTRSRRRTAHAGSRLRVRPADSAATRRRARRRWSTTGSRPYRCLLAGGADRHPRSPAAPSDGGHRAAPGATAPG